MNLTPYSAPSLSPDAPPMPQPGVSQPEMSPPGVSSYGISVPQSDAPQYIAQRGKATPDSSRMRRKDGWSSPSTICPPGLECLIALDSLYIKQKRYSLESVTRWETENKYLATDANGQPLYRITEESDSCARCCLGSSRRCEFHVVDVNQREVLYMVRPFKCCTQLLLEVYSGGVLLGTVTENISFFGASFSIRNASGQTVLRVKGSCFRICVKSERFKIMSADNVHRVGEIKMKWSNLTRGILADDDNFSMRFPVDLDVKIKAVLLGTCIVIDYLYPEQDLI